MIDSDGTGSTDSGQEAGLVAPTKAVRLVSALQATLSELHRAPIDEATRRRLIASHQTALTEVASTVSDALIDELLRLHMRPLADEASADQIRVAQAQLLGWVIGLIESGGGVDGKPLPAAPPQTLRLALRQEAQAWQFAAVAWGYEPGRVRRCRRRDPTGSSGFCFA